ncbi:MAG TPA: LLM class F420-dependent oxidoreductase [Acidimicrobiales bacterium]|nr:LLM class F420-dependent oxidoreductase [Acidimicrobiales bacterium]
MEIGVVYPQIELGGSPDALRRFATAVEELGFSHLVAYDHVLGAVHAGREPALMGPYTENDPFHDPLMMFSYLAGITPRLGFFSGILILPQRQTALVARQAADLDLFSGGRFRLGVGVGWNYVEYDALGQDFTTRGKREEEQIELLRKLWSEPVVDFSGRFDRVERAALLPRPTKPIPIWLGGWGEVAFKRAARLADGFIFGGRAADVVETWRRVQEMVAATGRAVESFGGEAVLYSSSGVERLAEHAAAWAAADGTHAAVLTMNHGFTDVEQHVDYLNQVRDALRL